MMRNTTLTLFLLICCRGILFSQFTPCDDLPGIIKSYKPSLTEDIPAWARPLYRYPVNYDSVCTGFLDYMKSHPGEKSPVIRYFKMWQRAVEGYVQDDGWVVVRKAEEKPTESLRKAYGERTAGEWEFVGPKETFWLNESGSPTAPGSCPWQANVYSFDVATTNPSILFCGTETGYVNKTGDKGLTWQLVGKNYAFGGGVTAVAIHPLDENIIYCAAGNQVHRSVDGGATWNTLLSTSNQFYADRLKIDPVNPQKIYAAASSGLYVSGDGGLTWVKKWSAAVYDVEIKPANNSVVFALTKSGGNFSMIESNDAGATFQTQASFPTNVVESSGGLLAMTPASPDIILAILLSANNTPYLIKATYSGTSWSWALLATGQTSAFPMNNGQGYFDLVLDISPVNEQIILVGTTTLFKSINSGTTFSAVGGYYGNFNIHPDIQDIRMLTNGDTWVSTDGGMNLTTDNFGVQSNYHVRINGLIGSDFWGFDQGWNEDIVVAGRYHNGNTSIADFYNPKALRMGGAESPTGWVIQGRSRHVAFDDLGNGWILPQTAAGKPEGRFIFSKYPNMDEYGGRRSNLVHHPNYYGTMFVGEGTGFWKSTDMGVTWDLLFNFPARVRYLQASYKNPDVLYADILGAGLVKSTDGGVSWGQKPTLTAPPYGTASWKGKLFFVISIYDENTIYACLQNGTWSADIGKVFRSTDGGDTWEDWTGTLNEYMKCMVIQPSSDNQDLVYLFTNATGGKTAKVFYRKPGMSDWVLYNQDYPAGMTVNMALPFFRDSKLRVGGNSGVWEASLADTAFTPVINPWVEKSHYDCMADTLFLDDHSILDHRNVAWHWDITPAPVWVENPEIRNPRVVLGNPGSYTIMLTVTKDGQPFSKSISVTASDCPSIYNCSNPGILPKSEWSLVYVDSEEPNDPGLAVMSFDDNPATIWHTRWSTGNVPYPHEIQIDMGRMFKVSKFSILNRQDGENGRIKEYKLFISSDTLSWGDPVSTGEWINTGAPQTILLDTGRVGRYFRLQALSEVNGNPWASAAEFTLTGCVVFPAGLDARSLSGDLTAFPVPTDGMVTVACPVRGKVEYLISAMDGKIVASGTKENNEPQLNLDLKNVIAGVYLVIMKDATGAVYRVKIIRR